MIENQDWIGKATQTFIFFPVGHNFKIVTDSQISIPDINDTISFSICKYCVAHMMEVLVLTKSCLKVNRYASNL